jgi:hypothetical protein
MKISDERLEELLRWNEAPDPHRTGEGCSSCDTASALRELRDLRAERDGLREALKRIDNWLDSPSEKGGLELDHVDEKFMAAWADADTRLAAQERKP